MSRFARTTLVSAAAVLAMVAGTVVFATPAGAATGGTISGFVDVETGPGTQTTGVGTVVELYPLHGSGEVAGSAVASVNGAWSVSGLPQDTYRIRFSGGAGWEDNATVWWGDGLYEYGSDMLELGALDVTNVDAFRPLGSSISGTISFTDGAGPTAAAAAFLRNGTTGQWERQSFRAVTNNSGQYEIRGLGDGQYLLRFGDVFDTDLVSTEYWNDADYTYSSDPINLTGDVTGRNGTLSTGGVDLYRLAGANRFETAAAVADFGWGDVADGPNNGADTVFIVNGLNFPDALSAGPAAAHFSGPILLATPDSLPQATTSALVALDPDYIVIVGGTATISSSVEAQLAMYANTDVYRYAGPNRYATSQYVATTSFDVTGAITAYIATGTNFPDALGAGAASGNEFGPLILVDGASTSIDSATVSLLSDLGVRRVVIAGGTGVISTSLEQSIAALPFIDEVYRRSGENRYDTAIKVAKASYQLSDGVFLATGTNFPDALAGAALAGKPNWRNPVFLVQPNCIPIEVLEEIQRLEPKEVYLLGGTATLGTGVQNFVPC